MSCARKGQTLLGKSKNHSDSTKRFSDNIFDMLVGRIFQHKVGIPMNTNYAPLLVPVFV
jgi:hypothetical protein